MWVVVLQGRVPYVVIYEEYTIDVVRENVCV